MPRLPILLALLLVLTGPTLTSAQASQWTCAAAGLKSFRYDGGDKAMIHLAAYSYGGEYPVTKVSETEVQGKTQDGTSFTCTKK